MSWSEELFCVSFTAQGDVVDNPIVPGVILVVGEQRTRYQAWAQMQDLLGIPFKVSYAQINVIPGKDGDSATRRERVKRSTRGALWRYADLMRGKGGVRGIPIIFSPSKIEKEGRN